MSLEQANDNWRQHLDNPRIFIPKPPVVTADYDNAPLVDNEDRESLVIKPFDYEVPRRVKAELGELVSRPHIVIDTLGDIHEGPPNRLPEPIETQTTLLPIGQALKQAAASLARFIKDRTY